MLIIQQEVHIFLVDIYQEDLRINININQFQNTVTREPARNTRRAGHCVYGNKAPPPHSLRGRCPLKNPCGLFSLYDFAGAKSRVRPGA